MAKAKGNDTAVSMRHPYGFTLRGTQEKFFEALELVARYNAGAITATVLSEDLTALSTLDGLTDKVAVIKTKEAALEPMSISHIPQGRGYTIVMEMMLIEVID